MEITNEELKILAQRYFEKSFSYYFSVCEIRKFAEYIGVNIDKDLQYKELSMFHCIDFKDLPKETIRKLIATTAIMFSNLGYPVNTENVTKKFN